MSRIFYNIRTYGFWVWISGEVGAFWRRICNTISWLPVIWNDRDFDWVYVYRIVEIKFRRLEHNLRTGYHLHSDKYADEVKIAAALCKRIHRDAYLFMLPRWKDRDCEPEIGPWRNCRTYQIPFERGKAPYHYEEYMLEQDIAYLHAYLTKHVRCWWD